MPKAKSKSKYAPNTTSMGNSMTELSSKMMAGNPALAKAWVDIMTDSARFVSDRLQQDMEFQQALLKCTSAEEMIKLQSEFFLKTMQQYADEAHRMSKVLTDASGEFAKHASNTSSRDYDDVPV